MSDFDLGYYYFMHDQHEEARELSSSGTTFIRGGIALVVVSAGLSLFFGLPFLMFFAAVGAFVVFVGMERHARVASLKAQEHHDSLNNLRVEVHHEPAGAVPVVRQGILRERISRPFSAAVSEHFRERQRIASMVSMNSGMDINSLYRLYRIQGGTLEPGHFVQAIHALKRHGVVRISKSASQTSFIPPSST